MEFYCHSVTVTAYPFERLPVLRSNCFGEEVKQFRKGRDAECTTTILLRGRTADGRSVLCAVKGEVSRITVELPDECSVGDMLFEIVDLRDESDRSPPIDTGGYGAGDGGYYGELFCREREAPNMDGFEPASEEEPTRPRARRFVDIEFKSHRAYRTMWELCHRAAKEGLPCGARPVELDFDPAARMLERRSRMSSTAKPPAKLLRNAPPPSSSVRAA